MKLEDLEKSLHHFGKTNDLDVVIVFGSMAKGTARVESDLDVAVASSRKLDLLELTDELIQATHINNIDLVDLWHCNPVVGMKAITEGKVIWRKKGALGTVGSYISRRYADTKKFREASWKGIDLYLKSKGLS